MEQTDVTGQNLAIWMDESYITIASDTRLKRWIRCNALGVLHVFVRGVEVYSGTDVYEAASAYNKVLKLGE